MKIKEILLIACLALLLHDVNCGNKSNKILKVLWGIDDLPAELDSQYELESKIGKGSFAKIILVKRRGTEPLFVALKVIDKKKMEDFGFDDEANIMRMLNHKYILKLIKSIETKKSIYLVIEYASGGDLLKYVEERKKMDEKDARRIFRQMIEAVEYCHYKNVSHRDLKPDNFLLDREGNIKLADFGTATKIKPNGTLNTFPGSPDYAAPEVKDEIPYDGRKSDVYSLGVCLYGMVTGNFPFTDKGKYITPRGVSPECAVLIRTLLEKDPKIRPTLPDIMVNGPNEWLNKDCEILEPYKEREPESEPNSNPPK